MIVIASGGFGSSGYDIMVKNVMNKVVLMIIVLMVISHTVACGWKRSFKIDSKLSLILTVILYLARRNN